MIERLKRFFSDDEGYNKESLTFVRDIISGTESITLPDKKAARTVDDDGSNVEDFIINFVRDSGESNALDILKTCIDASICSRATFFRKLKSLSDNGVLLKKKQGKQCFYTVPKV